MLTGSMTKPSTAKYSTPPGVGPEQAQQHLALVGADAFGGDVDLLGAGMLPGQVEHHLAELGVAAELAASPVEQHVGVLVRGAGAGRAPGEEAIDVRVGLEPLGELLRDQVEAAGPQFRVVHRREGVEDRAVERPAQLDGDVGGGLLGDLPDDHLVLQLQGGHRPVLQVEDEPGRTEGGGDGQDEGRRTPAPARSRHARLT